MVGTSKKIIPVSEELLEWIDQHRGDLDRDEFIGLCIDLALDGQGSDADDTEDEVVCVIPGGSQAGVRGPLRDLPRQRYGPLPPHRPATPQLTGQDTLPGATDAYPLRASPDVEYEYYYEDEEESKPQEDLLPLGWWVPALLLFGFGDTLTSALVFAKGGVEANPIMAFALSLPGGLWSFALVKIMAMAGLMLVSVRAPTALRWLVPAATAAVGSALIWWNVLTFLRMN